MKYIRSLSNKQLAILALIFANVIWGAASPIFKWSLTNIPLFTLAYLRFFGASLLLFPFTFKRGFYIAKKDWLKLIAASLLGITINISFFFLGLKHAASINAPIIASAGPIFLILFSFLFLHEKPRRKMIFGTLVSLAGIFVIIARPLLEKGFDFRAVEGNIYFVLATCGAIGHTLISKNLSHKYSALTVTFWLFVTGTISFFPFFMQEMIAAGGIHNLDIRGITGIVFGIFLSSTLAYTLYQWSVEKIDASEVGLFTYIDPVVATIIAIPLLGETVTPLFILGAFLVFVGIFVAEGRLNYHPIHKLRTPH